jgi:hypothetical protein
MQSRGAGDRETELRRHAGGAGEESSNKRSSAWGTIVSCLVLVALSGAAFFLFFYPVILNVQKARSWQTAECQILESRIVTHEARSRGTSRHGTTYSVHIRYKYEINGHAHISERYSFMNGGSDSTIKGKRAIIAKYRAGTSASCFVDPYDPSSAVLFRGYPKMMWFVLIPLLLAAVGLRGIIKASRSLFVSRL